MEVIGAALCSRTCNCSQGRVHSHLGSPSNHHYVTCYSHYPLLHSRAGSSSRDCCLAIKDLSDLHHNILEGSLQLGSFPVAGRLSRFLDVWKSITSDQRCHVLTFLVPPPVTRKTVETPLRALLFQCMKHCGRMSYPS